MTWCYCLPVKLDLADSLNAVMIKHYAVSHDIVYNGSKSCVLICSPNKTVTDPVFFIQNNFIVRKTKAKYLGHIINEDMSDGADLFRQVKCLYVLRSSQYYIEDICKLQHKCETCCF